MAGSRHAPAVLHERVDWVRRLAHRDGVRAVIYHLLIAVCGILFVLH